MEVHELQDDGWKEVHAGNLDSCLEFLKAAKIYKAKEFDYNSYWVTETYDLERLIDD